MDEKVCSDCQIHNPAAAKFCMNCGKLLPLTCQNCGTELPSVARFCFDCGHRLSEPSSSAAATPPQVSVQSRLHKYIPRELLEKLQAARARGGMVGERRVVTMLFCDVKGSTAAAEQLDPEDWAEIMNGAFNHLIEPVYHYEGTVARLMGDAVLAFFGAPITHENDAERAVLAGLDMVRGVWSYRDDVERRWGLEFDVRVGINTGLVVVGEVGSDLRVEYTAMGDAVNLAARMESMAVPGTVQITENTYKLVAPLFDVWEVGPVAAKGKTSPVLAYRVLNRKPQPGRVRGIEGLDAPLVGRDREMASLRRVVADLRAGRGQIVCLIGEAGLGKSRLIEELRTEWFSAQPAGVPKHWDTMAAVSYGTTDPYGMIKYQIRQVCGIQAGDPPEVVRKKLAHTHSVLPDVVRDRIQRVHRQLFGASPTGLNAETQLEGEGFKRELLTSTREAYAAQVGDEPTVYVFDDLHWGDAASTELLVYLLQLVNAYPVLFLCAFRPYREAPGWGIKVAAEAQYPHAYTEIQLGPLSSAEGQALVDGLLAIDHFPDRLRQIVLDKAEGNPFFVEEVVRTLIDRGIVERVPPPGYENVPLVTDAASDSRPQPSIEHPPLTNQTEDRHIRWQIAADVAASQFTIPDNLRTLLLARIDRLEEDCRHTVQLASVIGRSFVYRVLEAVSQATSDLDEQLTALQRLELVQELARVPELEYGFSHALTCEAAYGSISRKRRRRFHRWVGKVMEGLYGEQLEEYAAVLAHHFAEAGDDERALDYYTMAGDQAARVHANIEAIEHYSWAIRIARARDGAGQRLVYLYTRRGRTFEVYGRYDDALVNYQELEALARERDDAAMELAALIPQATLRSTYTAKFDPEQAHTLSEKALALAQQLEDHRAQAKIYWNLMLLVTYSEGDQQQALDYGERSLSIAREYDLKEELAYTLHDLTRVYAGAGQGGKALAVLEESGQLWRELGNLPMLADHLGTAAGAYAYIGQYDRSIEVADEAMRVSQRIGSLWGQAYSLITVAPVHLDRGEVDKAICAWETALPLAEQANFSGPQVFARALLAEAYALLGDLDYAFALVDQALDRVDMLGGEMRSFPLVMLARLHLQRGDLNQANTVLMEASIETDPNINSEVLYRTLLAIIRGEVALARQDFDGALSTAEQAVAHMRATGLHPYLGDLMLVQSRTLLAMGRVDDAMEVLKDAQTEAELVGSRRNLWVILLTLSQIEAELGDAAAAAALCQQAREVISFIADHAGTPELRELFLAREDVQELMRET